MSVSPLGDVWRIPPGSEVTRSPSATLAGSTPGTDFGLLGLAVDVFGNVYGAVQSANPAANGVWRFDRFTGDATRLPGTAGIGIANGLAFDKQANLYVTDSRAARSGGSPGMGPAAIWLQAPALTGDGSLGLDLGANGFAVQRGVFTVTNTERRTVLRFPKVGGEPGPISVLTTLPVGDNPDGVTMDVFGDAFVAMNLANAIAKVNPPGRWPWSRAAIRSTSRRASSSGRRAGNARRSTASTSRSASCSGVPHGDRARVSSASPPARPGCRSPSGSSRTTSSRSVNGRSKLPA